MLHDGGGRLNLASHTPRLEASLIVTHQHPARAEMIIQFCCLETSQQSSPSGNDRARLIVDRLRVPGHCGNPRMHRLM